MEKVLMKHADLLNMLQALERKWNIWGSVAPPSPLLPPQAGRFVRLKDNIQYFACSHPIEGKDDLPVVVDVGINYTQAKAPVPGFGVVDNLKIVAEQACVDRCNRNRPAWENTCLCSRGLPNPLLEKSGSRQAGDFAAPHIRDFHLVATNFSPWITTHSWASEIRSKFSPAIAADILAHPPHRFLKNNPFAHLDDLVEQLLEFGEPGVWIGHGVESVWDHFRLWTRRMKIQNWMMTANLSRPVRPVVRGGSCPFGGDLVRFG
jgi:hypothetical protein